MGIFRTREDNVGKISTSVYVTNFPESISSKELFNACKQYGHVVDSFIPTKRSRTGRSRLQANVARFNREPMTSQKKEVQRDVGNKGFATAKLNTGNGNKNYAQPTSSYRSYTNVVKGQEQAGVKNEGEQPVLVLDEDCLADIDVSNYLLGRVKQFASLANLKMALSNEGFSDIIIKYMGEFWVMLEFTNDKSLKLLRDNVSANSWFSQVRKAHLDFVTEGRIAWVEIEDDTDDACYHSKRLCILTKKFSSIVEDFKIIFRGKIYGLRATETPCWVPDFMNDEEEDVNSVEAINEEDINKKVNEFIINSDEEEIPETVFGDRGSEEKKEEEESVKKSNNVSEDPFNIYSILNKDSNKDTSVNESEGSLDHPPGFTPKDAFDDGRSNKKDELGCNDDKVNVGNVEEEFQMPSGVEYAGQCKEGEADSACSGHFKKSKGTKTGGSILSLLDDVVKIGQVMGYKMEGCVSNMAEIIQSQGAAEVGNSGGILCVWDPNAFCKSSVTISDSFVMVRGVWQQNITNLLIIAVYAPHDNNEKIVLWEYLSSMIGRWNGEVVIMGDFNEVRYKSDRSGSIFHAQGAIAFNSFIASSGLVEVALGGCSFMWCHKSTTKMSKLDIFLVSESLFNSCPNLSAMSLERIFEDQQIDLEGEVTKDEIKRAVWDCGIDKAPGPDGYTFGFYKKFWYLIGNDVYEAIIYFFTFGVIPKGCNSSFIALILKVPDANLVKDFWPISLIGSLYKIIAKILANKLVSVLGDIVSEVQSAFVADRQILDGPFILNEIMQWCKRKKKQTLVFKVDFEKAYDSVRWDFLDDILGKFGFGEKWRRWIQGCLKSSRGSIIINGSPTDDFQFSKGLKQGDPLSPFLFILVMESLHLSFQKVEEAGLFKGMKIGPSISLSHMFYADDAVFVGKWCESNITTLVHVLDCFHKASGLKINMSKSKFLGVHVTRNRVKEAASRLGCLTLKTPFIYLGMKVGGHMSRLHEWNEVVDRVKKRMSRWKMKTLSIGGRLTLLRSVLGSMTTFHMSIFKVPSKVLCTMESIRSHFFNGIELGGKNVSWISWKKWIWRFLSQDQSLWVWVIKAIHGENGKLDAVNISGPKSCWLDIVSEVKLLAKKCIILRDFMCFKLGNGEKTRFWEDAWNGGDTFRNQFPRLYALESNKYINVAEKMLQPGLGFLFRRNPRGGVEQH
uniref:RNA-directed DNA polymerase, eukaryota n=1 Tax=Tanacetum cinerariifolium TaxID=118510 RepID=A0A699HBY9_TANCI|nr:RNA-directed DNA polymerase, eukaryota [Tanacetum cinerariifolium]